MPIGCLYLSQHRRVGMVTGLLAEPLMVWASIPGNRNRQCVQTNSEYHKSSYPSHTRGFFRRFVKLASRLHHEPHVRTLLNNHHHKHQGLGPLIRSVSRVTAARANASSVFQLFSFLVVCSGMIWKGFGFVAFFASVKASSVCIHLSCLVCL